MFGFGTLTLIISKEEMNNIMKIKSLEESGLLIKSVSKTIKNEAKEQKGGYLSMLLDTLTASFLGNLLAGKGTITAGQDTEQVKALLEQVKIFNAVSSFN